MFSNPMESSLSHAGLLLLCVTTEHVFPVYDLVSSQQVRGKDADNNNKKKKLHKKNKKCFYSKTAINSLSWKRHKSENGMLGLSRHYHKEWHMAESEAEISLPF